MVKTIEKMDIGNGRTVTKSEIVMLFEVMKYAPIDLKNAVNWDELAANLEFKNKKSARDRFTHIAQNYGWFKQPSPANQAAAGPPQAPMTLQTPQAPMTLQAPQALEAPTAPNALAPANQNHRVRKSPPFTRLFRRENRRATRSMQDKA
ncbi:hypothetical protein F4677DRAFT_440689 [Hypoxylon crocopeplum]|nr:hypothetical protein F4677DRAFT_440689 [Hypoxylon crocopeplum]